MNNHKSSSQATLKISASMERRKQARNIEQKEVLRQVFKFIDERKAKLR